MKKIFVFILLFFLYTNSSVLAENTQIPNAEAKKQMLEQWLKSHPEKAKELKDILPQANNPTKELQQWLDANPDCAKQLQQLLMPENGQ